MTSLISFVDTNSLGTVYAMKCNNFFNALYAVKNEFKVYKNPTCKWKLESKDDMIDETNIQYYKAKMNCDYVDNKITLDNNKKACDYLRRARVHVIDDNHSDNSCSKSKKIVFKDGSWYAVVGNASTMDSESMRALEDDFKKHIITSEKNKKQNDNKELGDWVESYLSKSSKNADKVKAYENTVRENIKKEYFEKYGDKHKRKKDATVYDSPHFKRWFHKQMVKDDKKDEKKKDKKKGGAPMSELPYAPMPMPVSTTPSSPSPIYSMVLNHAFDRAFVEGYNNIIQNTKDIDGFLADIRYEIDSHNAEMDDIEEKQAFELMKPVGTKRSRDNQSFLSPEILKTDRRFVKRPRQSVFQPSFTSPIRVQGGGNNTQEQNKIAIKIYNDLHHDFNASRGHDHGSAMRNNEYENLAVFTEIKANHTMNEDEYMFSVMEGLNIEDHAHFTMDFVDDSDSEEDSEDYSETEVSKKLDELSNTLNALYVVEDMPLSKNVKREVLVSKNTYTNILDPITQISNAGTTDKIKSMIYKDINLKIDESYASQINSIATEFFTSVNHPSTWNLKEFRFNLQSIQDVQSLFHQADRLETFQHFKIEIEFENGRPISAKNNNLIEFNIYGGMFTVKRINDLIWWVTNNRQPSINVSEVRELKLWNAMKTFYGMLLSVLGSKDRAVFFIQMMKTLGDHSQIKEFVNVIMEGRNNVFFGSKDRIIIAEAIRLRAPTIFQLLLSDRRFPDEFPLPDKFQYNSFKKVFMYNPVQITQIDVSKTLEQYNVIRQNNGIVYDIQQNSFNVINPNTLLLNNLVQDEFTQYIGPIIEKINTSNVSAMVKKLVYLKGTFEKLKDMLNTTNYITKIMADVYGYAKRLVDNQGELEKIEKDITTARNRSNFIPPRRVISIRNSLTKVKEKLISLGSMNTVRYDFMDKNIAKLFHSDVLDTTDKANINSYITSQFSTDSVTFKKKEYTVDGLDVAYKEAFDKIEKIESKLKK